jgi:N-acetylglutamate synthase-like GNAT family acetyltransferase
MEHAFDLDPAASLVARVDGELVGLGNLGLRGADAWVGGVGVVPAHRGTGLGEALMRGLIEAARARGVERLWLEVIVENTAAVRLYEKLAFDHVRDVEVWSLGERVADSNHRHSAATLEEAHAWVRAHRQGREPWQRADETVARLAELDPPPHGVLVEGGGAVVRSSAGRSNLLQLAGDARAALEAVHGGGCASVSVLNLATDDPAGSAFRELGASVVVRQHEMLLELDAA